MKYNLSEISELIKDRRTIYPEDYSERKVHEEIVRNVLNSAIWAPSHKMTQPWRFKVFMGESRTQISELLSEVYTDFVEKEKFLPRKHEKITQRPFQSSVVVAICMERDPDEKVPEIEEVMAVACAVQNMSLHCAAYGLGTFWSTPKFRNDSRIKSFLKLQEKDQCLGFYYMGYPKVEWPKSHRKPLEYVTEWHKD
jgi:nitroreductase